MKVEIFCFGCHAKLRIPSIGRGNIICPHCSYKLVVSNGKIISASKSQGEKKRLKKEEFNSILKIVVFIILCVVIFSFKDKAIDWYNNRNNESTDPQLEYVNSRVHVYNLHYTVGLTGFNEVNTNMAEFDKLVWDKLKGNFGLRQVIKHNVGKDQYGNIEKKEQEFGSINLDELNKYQTFEDFKRAGGFYILIKNN